MLLCLQIWPLLRERSFGKLEGMPVEDFIAQAETDGHSIFWDYTPEGGEDLEQVRLRAKKFFEVKTEHGQFFQAQCQCTEAAW